MDAYLGIPELLSRIEGPNRVICEKIFEDHRKLFQLVPGSSHNHQAWPGGYQDHVQEAMNIAVHFHNALHSIRPLPFSLSDALLILFLHDIEKPWKYEVGEDGKLRIIPSLKEKSSQRAFREQKLAEYGIVLTPDQENAMKYVEGEFTDYTSQKRVMNPLAAFCHIADTVSARIWFDHPTKTPWNAERIRN